nr:hypothetical protein [Tanacetum cinerariifolium]
RWPGAVPAPQAAPQDQPYSGAATHGPHRRPARSRRPRPRGRRLREQALQPAGATSQSGHAAAQPPPAARVLPAPTAARAHRARHSRRRPHLPGAGHARGRAAPHRPSLQRAGTGRGAVHEPIGDVPPHQEHHGAD